MTKEIEALKISNMGINSKEVLADDYNAPDDAPEEPGELNVLEIKKMLIDIQVSVASVISEN